jgi:Flp pilus assembly protein TadG
MTTLRFPSRLRRLAKHLVRSDRGAAAVEFSIIAPVLILLMAAAFEIGRALQSVQAVNKLASQFAIAWADCTDEPVGTCGPSGELKQYTNDTAVAVANLAPQLSNTVTLQMFQVTMAGTTPTVVYSYPTGASLTAAQVAAAQSVLTSGQSGVVVTVSYSYQMAIFTSFLSHIIPSTIPMNYTVAQLKA